MTSIRASFQQKQEDPVVNVRVLTREDIHHLTREEADEKVRELLHQVRIKPEIALYDFRFQGSYVDPPAPETLLGYNTVTELSLPYCLYLPTGARLDVRCPGGGPSATVVLRKVWTELGAGSNEAEIYADDRLLYYGPHAMSTPTIPQPAEYGPLPRFTGRNIEIAKDTHGVFRYTQARVLMNTEASGTQDSAESRAERVLSATRSATNVVNYLLDIYRYVTGEDHVERLARITVNNVYFAEENEFSMGAGVEAGVRSAIVNRSEKEIDQISAMLATGSEPERHILLLQSAHAALDRGQAVLAIVVSFQALEILLERKLRDGYMKNGLSSTAASNKLRATYRTKDRLTTLCRQLTGSSVSDDSTFWDRWLNDCNNKRNGVVHRNEPISQAEAEIAVDLCEECLKRVEKLPFPM